MIDLSTKSPAEIVKSITALGEAITSENPAIDLLCMAVMYDMYCYIWLFYAIKVLCSLLEFSTGKNSGSCGNQTLIHI